METSQHQKYFDSKPVRNVMVVTEAWNNRGLQHM